MGKFFLAFVIIFILMVGWIIVQQIARKFASHHPEFGAPKEETGCGGCACATTACKKHSEH